MPRLREQYEKELRTQLQEKLGLDNVMAIPRLSEDHRLVRRRAARRTTRSCSRMPSRSSNRITGQKAGRHARLASPIAQFKLREGMPVGAMVTLRGDRMYEFLDRLISVVIPRIRDFRGLKRKFDGTGNYNMGLAEQSVFPEIDDGSPRVHAGHEHRHHHSQRQERGRRGSARGVRLPLPAGGGDRWLRRCLINKQQPKPKFSTRAYTRCQFCGRSRAVYRKFGICRICFRRWPCAGRSPACARHLVGGRSCP